MSRLSISVLTLTLAVVLTTSPLTHAATATQVESGVLNYVAHALNTVGEILLSIRDRLAGTFIPNDTLPAQVITGARILKETPEALTLKLLTLKKTYDTSSNKEVRANVHSQLIAVSKKRLNALSALVEENPQEALRLMLPATELQTLPLETRAFFEEEVTLEGTLEVRHTDDFENGIATYVYNLKLNTGKSLTLRPTDGIINQNGGRTVRVRGTKIGDTVLIDSTHTQSVQNLSTSETSSGTNAPIAFVPPQNTFGEQKTLVFLMTYKDQPNNQPFTVDFVRNMVFGPGKSVSNYFKEASYGQTWLTGDVVGWYPSSVATSTCDTTTFTREARAAATAAGVPVSSYTRFVYMSPSGWACAGAGSAHVGGTEAFVYTSSITHVRATFIHEVGHNLGLAHSRSLDCGATVLGYDCGTNEYGDPHDVMGLSSNLFTDSSNQDAVAHFNAYQKSLLGWLDYGSSPLITTATGNGQYTINPYETQSRDTKALRILKSTNSITGEKTWYYLEQRTSIGFDDYLDYLNYSSPPNAKNGLIVMSGMENNLNSSLRYDMTPDSAPYNDFNDAALTVGKTFIDPGAGVRLTTMATATLGTTVAVEFSAPQCQKFPPLVSVSPSSGYGSAGQSVTYQVVVSNPNTLVCPASTYTATWQVSGGGQAGTTGVWSQSPNSFSTTILPGKSATTSVVLTPNAEVAVGGYNFYQLVTESTSLNLSTYGNATYWLMNGPVVDTVPPSVAITYPTNGVSITRGTSVQMTAAATDNVGVQRVDFYVAGRLKCSDTTGPSYSCTWAVPKGGSKSYSLQAKAYDAAGNGQASSLVSVRVN